MHLFSLNLSQETYKSFFTFSRFLYVKFFSVKSLQLQPIRCTFLLSLHDHFSCMEYNPFSQCIHKSLCFQRNMINETTTAKKDERMVRTREMDEHWNEDTLQASYFEIQLIIILLIIGVTIVIYLHDKGKKRFLSLSKIRCLKCQ